MASDRSSYVFHSPGGPLWVTVTLVYRRAFIELMEQKGWNSPDVVMARQTIGLQKTGRRRKGAHNGPPHIRVDYRSRSWYRAGNRCPRFHS